MKPARFGRFEFHPATGELTRDGREVRLQSQPAKLLALLIDARGEVVTRESLRAALWPDGTTVDFDKSLNFAVAQVRTALGDSADSPTYIRTLPKRGYQFIAPLAAPVEQPKPNRRRILAVPAAAAAAGLGWFFLNRRPDPRVAVARFVNETGDAALDRFTGNLSDSVVARLTSETRYGVIGNAPILQGPRSFQDIDEIASKLQARYVIIGQVQQDRPGVVRILAHLIRMPEKTHVRVSRVQFDLTATPPESEPLARRIVEELNSSLRS